ncbi:MAG: hypothetical protein RL076_2846, partial [Chloroflexota bacterium]
CWIRIGYVGDCISHVWVGGGRDLVETSNAASSTYPISYAGGAVAHFRKIDLL